ncbi:MAG: hypothetical protein ACK55I_06535, partial [bacterium]
QPPQPRELRHELLVIVSLERLGQRELLEVHQRRDRRQAVTADPEMIEHEDPQLRERRERAEAGIVHRRGPRLPGEPQRHEVGEAGERGKVSIRDSAGPQIEIDHGSGFVSLGNASRRHEPCHG